ncbi:TPA: hypothetical protein I9094_001681 [Clostridium perfringens]|nr:hypothetical protein [Clostridium perfringens]HAT4346335.1 hypothetical protein [Clostridium perfringens]
MKKSNLLNDNVEVKCVNCGKNLLDNINGSMVIIVHNNNHQIENVIPCCKGKCDDILTNSIPSEMDEGWKEFSTFMNPFLHLKHIMSVMNEMFDNKGFANQKAFEDYKNIIVNTAPYITRDLTDLEVQEASMDNMFPF